VPNSLAIWRTSVTQDRQITDRGTRQHGKAGDLEVRQDALDGTGKAPRMAGFRVLGWADSRSPFAQNSLSSLIAARRG
jgi:hypothetical protein